ncbi:MAG: hypothetical protein JJU19_12315 [Pararhodobacter sp.]|nr:hypothetical protein [Pararhodobacter sp.]
MARQRFRALTERFNLFNMLQNLKSQNKVVFLRRRPVQKVRLDPLDALGRLAAKPQIELRALGKPVKPVDVSGLSRADTKNALRIVLDSRVTLIHRLIIQGRFP